MDMDMDSIQNEPNFADIMNDDSDELLDNDNLLLQSTIASTTNLDPKYTEQITHIIHISDIHIPLYKRHTEYREQFNKLYEIVTRIKQKFGIPIEQIHNSRVIIVITGDILHSKSDLSPECIDLTYGLLKALVGILPVVIIPGNHDLNINNHERLDSITPILCDLHTNYPIYYLKKTGIFTLSNLAFHHISIFDYLFPDPLEPVLPNQVNIALYHGRVNGAELFNGYSIDSEVNSKSQKTITPTSFKDYDMALLGDIHRHQFLTPNIAYAGSLIQQNIGETLEGHGLILWDVANKCGRHFNIANNWGYITIYFENGLPLYNCFDEANIHDDAGCTLPKNLHLRILYSKTDERVILDYIGKLRQFHNICDYSIQNDEDFASNSRGNGNGNGNGDSNDSSSGANSNKKKLSTLEKHSINIITPEAQNKYIAELLTNDGVPEAEIARVLEINIEANQNISASDDTNIVALSGSNSANSTNSNANSSTLVSGCYKLRKLEFSNLFSYGANNTIEFTNFNGIVGIIADNHMGKSAIIDIITYTLFDKFTRKGTVKDILNNRKNSFAIKMEIEFNDWYYVIIKQGNRTKSESSVSVTVNFRKYHFETKEEVNLNEDTLVKTKNAIASVFGAFDDIINTSFCVQNNSCSFIDAQNTARKAELERMLKLEHITNLYKYATTEYTNRLTIAKHLKSKVEKDKIADLQTRRKTASDNISASYHKIKSSDEEIAQLEGQLIDKHKQINPACNESYTSIIGKITQYADKYGITTTQCTNYHTDIDALITNIIESKNNDLSNARKQAINILTTMKVDDPAAKLDNYISVGGCTANIRNTQDKLDTTDAEIHKLYEKRTPINTSIKLEPNTTYADLLSQKQHDITSIETSIKTDTNLIATNNIKSRELTDEYNKYDNAGPQFDKDIEQVNAHMKLLENEKMDIKIDNASIVMPEFISLRLYHLRDKLTNSEYELSDDVLANYINGYYEYLSKGNDYAELIFSDSGIYRGYMRAMEYSIISSLYKQEGINQDLNTKKIGEIDSKLAELSTQLKTITSDKATSIKRARNIKSEFENINHQINKHEKSLINSQNKHRELLQQIEYINENIAAAQANAELDAKLAELKTKKEKYVKLVRRYNDINEIIASINIIMIDIANINAINEEYMAIKDTIESNKGIQTEIDSITSSLENAKIGRTSANREYIKFKEEYTIATTRIAKYRDDNKEWIEAEFIATLYGHYKSALKKLPFIIIQRVQPLLQKKVNDLLTIICDFTIKFNITESDIDLYLHRSNHTGKDIIINNASGFERYISSIAIRIALLEISNLPRINFMVIDEGWSSLDNHNINNVNIILEYLATKFDFIMTMSHLIQIKEHCDMQVNLRRDESGFSHVNAC